MLLSAPTRKDVYLIGNLQNVENRSLELTVYALDKNEETKELIHPDHDMDLYLNVITKNITPYFDFDGSIVLKPEQETWQAVAWEGYKSKSLSTQWARTAKKFDNTANKLGALGLPYYINYDLKQKRFAYNSSRKNRISIADPSEALYESYSSVDVKYQGLSSPYAVKDMTVSFNNFIKLEYIMFPGCDHPEQEFSQLWPQLRKGNRYNAAGGMNSLAVEEVSDLVNKYEDVKDMLNAWKVPDASTACVQPAFLHNINSLDLDALYGENDNELMPTYLRLEMI